MSYDSKCLELTKDSSKRLRIKGSKVGISYEIWRMKHVCEYLGVTRGHIYNLVSQNKIPYIKKGKLLYFIPGDIENWVLGG